MRCRPGSWRDEAGECSAVWGWWDEGQAPQGADRAAPKADIAHNEIHRGDLEKALGAITARTLIVPSVADLYFTAEHAEIEAKQMPHAEFRPIRSIWGHRAGNSMLNPEDEAVLRRAGRRSACRVILMRAAGQGVLTGENLWWTINRAGRLPPLP
jgi:hypothetical protein